MATETHAAAVTAVDAEVGRLVHHAIWERRVPHQQVYEAMGLSRSSLAKKMRGEVRWSVEDVLIVARVLGVTVSDLLPRLDSNQQPVGNRIAAYWRRATDWPTRRHHHGQ